MEEKKTSYTVDGNVNWYSQYAAVKGRDDVWYCGGGSVAKSCPTL